jgi:integrase
VSIYKRKSGRWAALVDMDRAERGLRKRRSLGTFGTRKEAERAERRALEARDRGIDLAPRTVTLDEVVERFLRDCAPRLAPTTVHRYTELWRLHIRPTLGSMPMVRLRPAHIGELYARLGTEPRHRGRPLGARTVHHIHRLLHRILSWAENLDLVERNVSRAVDPPVPGPSRARALTPDEAATFLNRAEGSRLYPFFLVALTTGMRRGELGALTWSSIDFEHGTVLVRQAIGNDRTGGYFLKPTKTGRERTVPLAPQAIDALRALLFAQTAERLALGVQYCDEGFVFADKLGRPIKLDVATKTFTSIAHSVGVKGVRLHDLRHSAATWALADGNDVRTVAAILGHSAPSTTLNIYGHVVAGLSGRAVASLGSTLARAQARRLEVQNRAGS